MQDTSELYKQILMGDHWFEHSLVVGESGRLVTKQSEVITFGGDSILVDSGGAESGFREDMLVNIKTQHDLFKDGKPQVGSAISAEIKITMIAPYGDIPRRARLTLFTRATNGIDTSEWIQHGLYFIDTRKQSKDSRGYDLLTLTGYDAMLLADVSWPSDDKNNYPMLDIDMVKFIADQMGISVDRRTIEKMTRGYVFPLPVGYSMREVLGMIASAYGGNFIITGNGELRLVSLNEIPPESRYLIDEDGYRITFGGVHIKV